MKLYNVIAINDRKGWQVLLTNEPMPHAQACAYMRRFTYHPARRIQLQQA